MKQRAGTEAADRRGLPQGSLSPVVVHLLLTVGILVFEWDFVELILIYLSEIVVVAVLFAVASLFAAQPIEDHDASTWRSAPNPVQPSQLFRRCPRETSRWSSSMSARTQYSSSFLLECSSPSWTEAYQRFSRQRQVSRYSRSVSLNSSE